MFINNEIIQSVPLFKVCPPIFVRSLAMVLEPQVFVIGDFIIKQGGIGDEMYFMNKGVVEVFNNAKTFTVYKTVGDFFGEVALLHNVPRTANVRAITRCDIFVLAREDYENVLRYFPDLRESNKKTWLRSNTTMVKMGYNKDLLEGNSPKTDSSSSKNREVVRKISQGKELNDSIEEKVGVETKLEDEDAADMSLEQLENAVKSLK